MDRVWRNGATHEGEEKEEIVRKEQAQYWYFLGSYENTSSLVGENRFCRKRNYNQQVDADKAKPFKSPRQ